MTRGGDNVTAVSTHAPYVPLAASPRTYGAPHLRVAAVACGLGAAGLGVTANATWLMLLAAGTAVGALVLPSGATGSALIVAGLAAGGLILGQARMAQTAPGRVELPTSFTGDVVVDGPVTRRRGSGWRVVARVRSTAAAGVPTGARIMLTLPTRVTPGAILHLRTTLRAAARPGAPAWWRRYLDRMGVVAQAAPRGADVRGHRGGVAGLRDAAAAAARRVLARSAHGDAGAIVGGIAVGADEDLSEDARERFRRAGLSHLLAVSGQNVALIGICAMAVMQALGASRAVGLSAAGGAVAGYAAICQPGASVGRAAVAALAVLAAEAWSRPHLRWHVLVLALIVLLAWQPRAVTDPGLLLSFAAVAGILALMPLLQEVLRGRMPDPLAAALAVSGAASLATAPVLVLLFGELSLAGLVANLAAVPLAGVVLIAALAGIAADALVPWGAGPALMVAGGGAQVLLVLARLAASVPGASVVLPAWTAPLTAVPALAIGIVGRRRSTGEARPERGRGGSSLG